MPFVSRNVTKCEFCFVFSFARLVIIPWYTFPFLTGNGPCGPFGLVRHPSLLLLAEKHWLWCKLGQVNDQLGQLSLCPLSLSPSPLSLSLFPSPLSLFHLSLTSLSLSPSALSLPHSLLSLSLALSPSAKVGFSAACLQNDYEISFD